MKTLIWLGCFLVNGLIVACLREMGIILGLIPTVLILGGLMFGANAWCKRVDRFVPILNNCANKRNNPEELKKYLDDCLRSGIITKRKRTALLKKYTKEEI